MMQQLQDLHSKIRREDGDLLFNYKVRRHTFKAKKLSVYFVEKLMKRMRIPEATVAKCIKAPLATIAKVLAHVHKMVQGKLPYTRLADLRTILCEDLKIIPDKIKDPFVFNDVKGYIERHVRHK